MENVLPAGAAGLLCGFVASVGVGPVNLTVIEQGLRRGFRGCLSAGAGAISAETIYAGLALTGQASLLPQIRSISFLVHLLAVGVVVVLGLRYLLARPQAGRLQEMAREADRKWNQHRAWLMGFLVTISNLTLLILWATLAAVLFAHHWVRPVFLSRMTCTGGVFLGGLSWYFLVASFVARAHRQVPLRLLVILQRFCGAALLAFAIFLSFRIFR